MRTVFRWFFIAVLAFLQGCSLRSATVNQDIIEQSQPSLGQPTPAGTVVSYEDLPASVLFDLAWGDRSVFLPGLITSQQYWASALPGASLYRIELVIPEEMETLEGSQEVVFTNQESSSLNEIYFRLFANSNGGAISVSSLRVNGKPVEYFYESSKSALKVPLEEALLPGEHLLIQLDFSLQIPREMGGNFGLFGFFEDILVLDLFYPTIPAYDQEGWYSEQPSENGDLSYYDASFYLVRVVAPESLVLVASGVELESEGTGGVQKTVFAAGPARDFSLAASEKFTVLSETVGETRLNSYVLPGYTDAQALALETAAYALQGSSSRIGVFDYTEFDVVAAPMGAGGIEYPGMTWINMDYYDLNETFYGLPASRMLEGVIAHEVGHHWFYNVVGNSQVKEAWLDEALVQYITGLYYLDRYGKEAYEQEKGSWNFRWDRIDFKNTPIGLASAAYDGYEYVAAVYGRGPYFFEALAEKMGEKEFRSFLNDYYQRFHWQVSTGEQLKQLAETHCKCDLTQLFVDWVYAR